MTLNQVIQRIETLALGHRQINHFFMGDIPEWLSNGDVRYPACFLQLADGRISRTDKYTYFNFKLWLCDLADVATNSQANEIEVQSDLTSIAEDLIAMIGYSEYRDWDVTFDSRMQFYTEKFEDIVIGLELDLTIGVRFDANRCQVPSDSLTFETSKDMIMNYIYMGLGTEGASVTIGTLVSRNILMLFKGDKLLTPTTNTPGVNEYRYTYSSGRFEFGNDIEAGQVIQILHKSL